MIYARCIVLNVIYYFRPICRWRRDVSMVAALGYLMDILARFDAGIVLYRLVSLGTNQL